MEEPHNYIRAEELSSKGLLLPGAKCLLEHNKRAKDHLSETVNSGGQPHCGHSLGKYTDKGERTNYRSISVNSQVASGISLKLAETLLSQCH